MKAGQQYRAKMYPNTNMVVTISKVIPDTGMVHYYHIDPNNKRRYDFQALQASFEQSYKPLRGGARNGSGRKDKGIKTTVISFRVPITKAKAIHKHLKKALAEIE